MFRRFSKCARALSTAKSSNRETGVGGCKVSKRVREQEEEWPGGKVGKGMGGKGGGRVGAKYLVHR